MIRHNQIAPLISVNIVSKNRSCVQRKTNYSEDKKRHVHENLFISEAYYSDN